MTSRKKYSEIMDHIVVTKDMRQRVLQNIRSAGLETKTKALRFPHWERYAAAAACFAVLLISALTIPGLFHSSQNGPAVDTQSAGGIVECRTAGELSKEIGFPVSDITVLPFEPAGAAYRSIFGETAEIDYTGADGQSAVFRKSRGTDDNSGIYDTFTDTEQIAAGDVSATVKGSGSRFTLAAWTDGTYSYSIELSDGAGIDEWRDIIDDVSRNIMKSK